MWSDVDPLILAYKVKKEFSDKNSDVCLETDILNNNVFNALWNINIRWIAKKEEVGFFVFFFILPPVIGTSGLGCSFLHEGTNTVTSVCPRSRKKFTVSWIPRHENTSLLPWLNRQEPEDRIRKQKTPTPFILAPAFMDQSWGSEKQYYYFHTRLQIRLDYIFNSHK